MTPLKGHLALALLAGVLLSCEGLEGDVGTPCNNPHECSSRLCVDFLEFGVLCTARCDSDENCPEGWLCNLRMTLGDESLLVCAVEGGVWDAAVPNDGPDLGTEVSSEDDAALTDGPADQADLPERDIPDGQSPADLPIQDGPLNQPDTTTDLPQLTVDSFWPSRALVSGGAPVTVTGSGLSRVTQVLFGAVSADFEADEATLLLRVPPGPGPGDVEVTLVAGEETQTLTLSYIDLRPTGSPLDLDDGPTDISVSGTQALTSHLGLIDLSRPDLPSLEEAGVTEGSAVDWNGEVAALLGQAGSLVTVYQRLAGVAEEWGSIPEEAGVEAEDALLLDQVALVSASGLGVVALSLEGQSVQTLSILTKPLEFLGQIHLGGLALVSPSTVAVCNWGDLASLDVSDVESLDINGAVEVGGFSDREACRDVLHTGQVALALAGSAMLSAVDVPAGDEPLLLSQAQPTAECDCLVDDVPGYALALLGDLAVAAGMRGSSPVLLVFDASDPSRLAWMGSAGLVAPATDLAVLAQTLLVVEDVASGSRIQPYRIVQ